MNSSKSPYLIKVPSAQSGMLRIPSSEMEAAIRLLKLPHKTYKGGYRIHAEYNPMHNSIDINHYDGYVLRIDCNQAESGIRTTPNSQRCLNALAIDNPLEYVRPALDGDTIINFTTTEFEIISRSWHSPHKKATNTKGPPQVQSLGFIGFLLFLILT